MCRRTPRNYEKKNEASGGSEHTQQLLSELALLLVSLAAAGCATSSSPARNAFDVECTEIVPGVELTVSDNAGPEARRIADDIRVKYAAELMTSRPTIAPRWPAR
jgi:hypothetical protein